MAVWPLERVVEFGQAGFLGGAAQEGVLDDVASRARLAEAVAQFGELVDLQAGVIDHEEERRGVRARLRYLRR